MGEVIELPSDWKWILTSAALHAGVFAFFAFKMLAHTNPVPLGVDIKYTGEIEATLRKAPPAAIKSREGDVVVKKPRAEKVAAREQTSEKPSRPLGRADGAQVSEAERYRFELEQFLQSRLVYPESARRLHQMGTVIVGFRVAPDGSIGEVVLREPCGSGVLNQAAQELVKRAGKFKPLPVEYKSAGVFEIPIRYRL